MLSLDEFKDLLVTYRTFPGERIIIPLHRRRSADLLTPVSAFLQLRKNARMPFLFRVSGGRRKDGAVLVPWPQSLHDRDG